MKPGEYAELPIAGTISVKSGEVLEYRAGRSDVIDGVYIVHDAYFRDGGEITGPWTLRAYFKGQPGRLERLKRWVTKKLQWLESKWLLEVLRRG